MITKILIEHRKLLGYSQQDVADKVESIVHIIAKSNQVLAPSVRVAQRLGETLGIDWTIFFNKGSAKIA